MNLVMNQKQIKRIQHLEQSDGFVGGKKWKIQSKKFKVGKHFSLLTKKRFNSMRSNFQKSKEKN